MMNAITHAWAARFALVWSLIWLALPAVAADPAGHVSHLQGILAAERDGARTLLALQSQVQDGDQLDTAQNSYARVHFLDDSELILRPDSRVKVAGYHFVADDPDQDRSVIELLKGGLRRVSGLIGKRNPPQDTLHTPVAIIGIRGTHYGMLLCQGDCDHIITADGVPLRDGLHIDVEQGQIAVNNGAGEVTVQAGQFAFIPDNVTPPKVVPPREGVRVTAPAAILRNNGRGQTLDITHCDGQCVVP